MILLQTQTRKQIEKFISKPSHGLILNGPDGAGKTYIAAHIAAKLLDLDDIVNYPYLITISPIDNSLGIDQIRELQKFLQLKTPGKNEIRRIAIIEHAHLMTNEAQNALLKSLEEPPADTVIILTASMSQKIKHTVYSRVQRIDVLPVGVETAAEFFKPSSKEEFNKIHLLSGGNVGILHALLHDTEHKLAGQIQIAKQVMVADRYERLLRVDEMTKVKESIPLFLQACKVICSAALHQSLINESSQAKRWHSALQSVYKAESLLPSNPSTKLLLSDLMLHL